ncbi:MAG: hypothetical protein [Wendovervirus sonii]|uniref:Uncharacterized protein n=1 Tax=phage Lak_Megaphage_Sonny TaxID=3109229 RepID=A0ABZ0Z2U8_9CAUD|nr:MAG: hypothetical protein [phage Lak_Megaphage_Sonny]
MELKENWKNICNEYVQAFADKHEYDIEYELKNDYLWVGNDPGTIACIGDMFIGIDEIRYDIDYDVPENYFEEWYWKHLEAYENKQTYMNYESFCKGCPDPNEKERVLTILKNRVEDAKRSLEAAMDEYMQEKKKYGVNDKNNGDK